MTNSATVAVDDLVTAAQHNNLRADILDPATGHRHEGGVGRLIRPAGLDPAGSLAGQVLGSTGPGSAPAWQPGGLVMLERLAPDGVYRMEAGDVSRVVTMDNATAGAIIVPSHAVAPIPVGSQVGLFQLGAGAALVWGGAGAFVRAPTNRRILVRHDLARLWKRSENEWVLTGDPAMGVAAPNSWLTMAPIGPFVAGGGLTWAGGDHIFATQGGGTTFRRYSIAGNSWATMAPAPLAVGDGGALAWAGGDHIFATQGGGTTTFWRYSIAGNSWLAMTPTPAAVGSGASMTWAGGDHIFATQGGGTTTFRRYSIAGNSWLTLAPTPATIGAGSGLSAGVPGDNLIHVSRGGGAGNVDFWRYLPE